MEEKNIENNNELQRNNQVGNQINQNLNNNNEKANNKNNTFNIIMGIATLLIAILGATFAYFSATARSKENDVSVKSAYVSISYDGGTEIKASNLIPATQTVALNMYTKVMQPKGQDEEIIEEDEYTNSNSKDRRCIDVNGREVCYVYQFTVKSEGVENGTTNIMGAIEIGDNQFENLSYYVYEVELGTEDEVDKFGNRIVKRYIPLENNFKEKEDPEKYPDNVSYQNYSFAKFETPFEKVIEGSTDNRVVKPLACLFGYSNEYDSLEEDDISRCSTYSITNNTEHTFQVVIWLEETKSRQDEQGKEFSGTVNIEVPGGQIGSEYEDGRITGKE